MEEADTARIQLTENVRRFLTFTGATRPSSNALFILVMGMTGSGKSSFVSACTGKSVIVGHDLRSCTRDITIFDFDLDGYQVYLIDTPGFNDTNRSDKDTLHAIATYLATSYAHNVFIHGVVYLHRINDNRVSGSSKRNIDMFRSLCGDTIYSNVAIATTMWPDSLSDSESRLLCRRETELARNQDYFGTILSGGGRMFRHAATIQTHQDSARAIIKHLIQRSRLSPVVLLVQHELVDNKKHLDDTLAGSMVAGELGELAREHKRQVAILKQEVKALHEKDSERKAEMKLRHSEMRRELHEIELQRQSMKTALSEMQSQQQEILRERLDAMDSQFRSKLRRYQSDLVDAKTSLRLLREDAKTHPRPLISSPREKHELQLVEFEKKVEDDIKEVRQKEVAVENFTDTKKKLLESLTSGTISGAVSGLASGGASAAIGTLLCIIQ